MSSENTQSDRPRGLQDRILSGEPLDFQGDAPGDDRTLEAEWIAAAVAAHVRVSVRNAIVRGPLRLRYVVAAQELEITQSQFMGQVDLSYATFTRNVTLSGSRFEAGLSCRRTILEHDLKLDAIQINGGSASFDELLVKGVCLANGMHVGPGVPAVFNRAQFKSAALFLSCVFGGDTSFRGVRFEDQAAFQGATFSTVNFNSARVRHHALFRSEPSTKTPGAIFGARADFSDIHVGGEANFSGAEFRQDAIFEGSQITGALLFGADPKATRAAAVFHGSARFTASRIQGDVNFSGVICKGPLVLDNVVVQSNLRLDGSRADGFSAAVCEDTATFISLRVTGSLNCRGVRFHKAVNFSSVDVGRNAVFSNTDQIDHRAAVFENEVSFLSTCFHGQADFRGTVFSGIATFNSVEFKRGAFFRNSVSGSAAEFRGAADFTQSLFGHVADFRGAVFAADVTFDSARFDGNAYFDASRDSPNSASFLGSVSFSGVRAALDLGLSGVRFKQTSTWTQMSVSGGATFVGSVFEAHADFGGAHFGRVTDFSKSQFLTSAGFNISRFSGDVLFDGTVFGKGGDLDFRGAHFKTVADFKGVRFESPVDFYAVQGEGLARFAHAEFHDDLILGDASFVRLDFGLAQEAGSQFRKNVDLAGCVYEHVQVDWRTLLLHLEPYDRQSYVQLERVFRSAGRDDEADAIYLARQHRERKQHWTKGETIGWISSAVHYIVANYGVRPYQLAMAAAVLLAIGTLYFAVPGTVVAKEAERMPSRPMPVNLSMLDAAGVSLHQFLPVDVPFGSQWIPADTPVQMTIPVVRRNVPTPLSHPAFFATFFLRLAGWLLVPLGVAALTGLLRVKA